MKKWLSWLAGVFLLLTITGGANASSYQVINDPDDVYMSWLNKYTWTSNIGDLGIDLSSQTVDSASIQICLYDDDERWWKDLVPEVTLISVSLLNDDDETESYSWKLDWSGWDWSITDTYTLDITSLFTDFDTLDKDATLVVEVTALLGDFYFDSASLDVTVSDTVAGIDPMPTPEPNTLLLLGSGLLGLATTIRRLRS